MVFPQKIEQNNKKKSEEMILNGMLFGFSVSIEIKVLLGKDIGFRFMYSFRNFATKQFRIIFLDSDVNL